MSPQTWREIVVTAAVITCVVACAGGAKNEPASSAPAPAPVASPSVAGTASDVAPPTPPATTPPSACHPPAPGTTSEDVSPTVRGAGAKVPLVEWVEARGVSRDAMIAWLTTHYGHGLTKEHAEAAFAESACATLRVGDRREEAIVCEHAVPTLLMEVHALTLVVRSKRPVAVLDVGTGLLAMDFPDARWLDLSLAIASDGSTAELGDRAPDGTMLIEPQSRCLERERHVAECEKKLAAHPDPESFAQKIGRGETFRPLDDCPLHRAKDGKIVVLRQADLGPGFSPYPAKLHDCAGARQDLVAMQRDLAQAPPQQRTEARQAVAFVDKACAQRGRYVWQNDRFVKTK